MDKVSKTIFEDRDYASLFKWPEYCVFASVLALSMGIGVFYGCFHKKNRTTEEFLMGGRSMSVFPVALSLICSFVSAITMMGTCVEVFYYGFIYIFFSASFIPLTLSVAFLYMPVIFNLQLTSAYEYFELRFNRRVRLVISVSAVVHLLIYMPLTTWAPSLALEQVAGIDKFTSSAVIFIVCIAYSSLGGLKAVLWTDALQAMIMLGSMITVAVVGAGQIGGFEVVLQRARDGGRLQLWNIDTDPRTRHTWWTGIFGAYFSWISLFGGAQAQYQRYLSVPTLQKARLCLLLNMIGLFAVVFICSVTGLTIYAKYYDCDPASVKGVTSTDQLLPLFVMDVLGSFRGLPGLMVAGLTCGSLSSVSSALNALPSIIVEDFIKPCRPDLSEVKLASISKVISLAGGLISFSLIFVIALTGNVLPFSSLLHGTFLGPACALFSLGMFFPWANSIGSCLGVICSLALSLFIGVGSIVQGTAGKLPNQRLPLRTDGCFVNDSITTPFAHFEHLQSEPGFNTVWKTAEYTPLNNLFALSYLWQPLITIVSAVVLGSVFSLIVGTCVEFPKVKSKHMAPVMISLWRTIFGEEWLRRWVDFAEDEVSKGSKDNEMEVTKSEKNGGECHIIGKEIEGSSLS